jgi:HELP motif
MYRDLEWASITCKISWPAQGIWPAFSDGSDINAVCRGPLPSNFNPKSPQDTSDTAVLATADDFGCVKLFKYPCVIEKSDFQKSTGHSSHVTNVCFINNGKKLISTGGMDKAIFVWKVKTAQEEVIDEEDVDMEGYDANEFEGKKEYSDDEEEEGEAVATVKKQTLGIFEEEEVAEGEEFMAVKPFVGQIKAPTGHKDLPKSNDAPTESLTLKYVHGYRCFDSRNCAKWKKDSDTEVVFVSAALGVKMDTSFTPQKQTFFNVHDEDLVSFDLHPHLNLAVSG